MFPANLGDEAKIIRGDRLDFPSLNKTENHSANIFLTKTFEKTFWRMTDD